MKLLVEKRLSGPLNVVWAPLLVVFLTANPSPLPAARQHLAAGELELVVFDLDVKQFSEEDTPAAVEVLARAGEAALSKPDLVLALQFAQMALRLRPEDALALEVGARAARSQKQYGPAERYADRWVTQSDGGARARLLRAELAMDEGEWENGLQLVSGVPEGDLTDGERVRLTGVNDTCHQQAAEKRAGLSQMKSVEGALDAVKERAKVKPPDRRVSAHLVYCMADSDCQSGAHCSQVVLWTDASWKQTLTAPRNWMEPSLDDSTWRPSVEQGPAGVSPWAQQVSMPDGTPAQWIWHRESRGVGDTATVYFRKHFTTAIPELTLTMTADNSYEVYVDGDRVGGANIFFPSLRYALDLLPGAIHVLAIRAVNSGGPGGAIADIRSSLSFCQPGPPR